MIWPTTHKQNQPRWPRLLWLSLLGLLLWGCPRPLAAQEQPSASQIEVVFGQSLTFSLTTAVGHTPVERLTLFVQQAQAAAPYFVDVPFAVSADGVLSASTSIAPAQLSLPPFAQLTYWWQLGTAVEPPIDLDPQTAVYQDDRFLWQQLVGQVGPTAVTLFWTGDDDVPGQAAYRWLQSWLPRLQQLLHLPLNQPLPLFLYPSSADLRAGLRLHGYDWVGQQTDPAAGVMMVTAVNSRTIADDLRHSLPNELAQFWLYQAAGPHYNQLPLWLKAGLPIWLQADEATTTAVAPPLLSLTTLCQSAFDPTDSTAVAHSAALFTFLETTYGADALADLVLRLVAGQPCQTAVPDALGQSFTAVDGRWQATSQAETAYGRLWQAHGLWMLLLLASFAIMALLVFQPRSL